MANPLRNIFCPISGEIIQHNHGIEGSISTFLSCFEEENELLGNGGFGVAVKCRHKIDGISYVVKKIELQQTGMSFEKIKREVEILGKIRHPNIIRYYYSWVEEHICGHYYDSDDHLCTHKADSPCLYIQMEFCPNKLSSYLLNVEIDMARRFAFIRQLVDAVSYMHSLGIIHRDLSCENILLDEYFNIKIIDFGQAIAVGEMDHVHSNSNGARYYMAPELKIGEQIDSKVDIFSLGVLFFELLNDWRTNSERIHQLANLQHHESRLLMLKDFGAHGMLIKDMLEDDPRVRPLASLIQELMPWMDNFEYMGMYMGISEQTVNVGQAVVAEQAMTVVGAIVDVSNTEG